MSHYIAVTSLPADGEKFESSKFIAWRSIFMLGGVAGFAISLFLFFMGGDMANSYAFSYLWAFEVFFTITCGALFWCLLHNASNSSWGVAIRRIPETIAQSFVFLFFMGLPLVLPFVGVGSKPEYMAKMYE